MVEKRVDLVKIFLGGTGRMFSFVDQDGKTYIFKPAEGRYDHSIQPFRAHVSEFASYVQSIIDSSSAVPCSAVKINEIIGSVQPMYDTDSKFYEEMSAFKRGKGTLSKEELHAFLREFVVDYLLCNFDSHLRNFIRDKDGIIRGVDKEQSFRYWKEDEAQKPSYKYHPNQQYGEDEPIYNYIFRQIKKGQIILDEQDKNYVTELTKKLKNITKEEYEEALQPYADELCKNDIDKKIFYDFALERKNNAEQAILGFLDTLENKDTLQ